MQRETLAGVGLLLMAGLLLAVGSGEDHPKGQPLPPEEAKKFAALLAEPVSRAAEKYVLIDARGEPRTVSFSDLLYAALQGLYEAARIPVPSTLREDIQKATTDQEILALVATVRQSLGDPEALRGENGLLAGYEGMTRALDPYSVVINGDELNRSVGNDEEHGIGIEVTEKVGGGPLVVKAVTAGGPAQKAGLQPGDQIVQVNRESAEDITSAKARLYFANSPAIVQVNGRLIEVSRLELTLTRPGTPGRYQVTLQPETFRPETVLGVRRNADNTWDYWADRGNKIAHVRVAKLTTGTTKNLFEVLTALQGEGLRGLILDFRWCPGGFLTEAAATARLFLGKCTIATLKAREEEQKIPSEAGPEKFLDFPLVVLVNGETSGGAELVAAALQDNARARVAGQRTLGKGSVQDLLVLPVNNAAMKLTKGAFLRPNGKNLHRFPESRPIDDWGVRPDENLEYRVSPELGRQLGQWWLLQTLRPGPSNEALPLDDPEADPQRQAALQALLTMAK